jgi:hypothetical protein
MSSKPDDLRRAADFVELVKTKTAEGKIGWSLLAEYGEHNYAFYGRFGGGFTFTASKQGTLIRFVMKELAKSVDIISEEIDVAGDYGYETTIENRFAKVLTELYELIERQVFDIDRKLMEARSELEKL